MAERWQGEKGRAVRAKQKKQENETAIWQVVRNMDPAAAKALETDLKAHPNDPDKLLELVRYYQSSKNPKALDALTFWFIGQHPEIRENWGKRPAWDNVWDQNGYLQGKQLWTAQLKKTWGDPYVYMNAADYLAGGDNEQAEQILLEGRRLFPPSGRYSGLHWEMLLAHLYAWALVGPDGPMTDTFRAFRSNDSSATNQGPFAEKVRATLLASNDVDLLNRTVERLQGDGPNRALAQSLNARALSIRADDRQALYQRDEFRRYTLELRSRTDPGSLDDAERMALLRWGLTPHTLIFSDATTAEAKAHELLGLASHNTKDPDYGTAVFLANMALGDVALYRENKSEAVRYLLAASEAPSSTEFLRYNQIDMSLAAKLVDAGERDAVATFLEHCTKFDKSNNQFAEWASEIRKGINPRMNPTFDLFRQAG